MIAPGTTPREIIACSVSSLLFEKVTTANAITTY